MANPLITGGDFEGYEDFCDTLANQIKNHWRDPDPLSNWSALQPGMIVSDSATEKLYHITELSGGHDLILQEYNNQDAAPIFSRLGLDVTVSDVSNPPTDSELRALFGSPGAFGNSKFAFVRDTASGAKAFLILAHDGEFFAVELAECV
jgi:hypothetical protein